MTDTDFKSRKFRCTEMFLDRFDAIVAAGRAFASDAQLAAGQIKVILDHCHILWCNMIKIGKISYRKTAEVHIGSRFNEKNLFRDAVFDISRIIRVFPFRFSPTPCQFIGNHKAYIMAGIFIFLTDIAKSYY
ncbi:hypothetical protein SDC9_108950 [bioreactor metagenome]|uniref:Uncharacterized protein n=1 Tax=bioreactor metagenome TaxID=1076179 RepID=A0A645BJY6_9ZZZZ